MIRRVTALFFLFALPLLSQSNRGELRLRVTDPSGRGVKTAVHLLSAANQYQTLLQTDEQGSLDVQHLPYGKYELNVDPPGFAPVSESLVIGSSLPLKHVIELKLPTVNQSVTVNAADTLIDAEQAGSVSQIGSDFLQHRLGSIPGRSLQDLVNSQPGWLYEGNPVLHPRGSEYQTQFVMDGIPLTDNRSPSFGPEIEADDLQSMSIYTAGIPAEYGERWEAGRSKYDAGRTARTAWRIGFVRRQLRHRKRDREGAIRLGQEHIRRQRQRQHNGKVSKPWFRKIISNTGTLGDFSGRYQRELTENDRLSLTVRHALSRYDLPNEQVQQAAGQRQTADNIETMGIASYEHIFLPIPWPIFEAWFVTMRRISIQRVVDSDRSVSAQPVSRGIFQSNRNRESRSPGMEVRG